MSLSHSPKIVTSNLIMCIDSANYKSYPKSGTVTYNIINTSNQLVLANGASYTSNNKGTFTLDGGNDCIILNDNTTTDNLSNMTLSVWAYRQWSNTSNYMPIISKMTDYMTGAGWDLSFSGGKRVSWLVQESGGARYKQFLTQSLSDLSSRWYNFTGSHSGINDYNSYRIYVNGERQSSLINSSAGGPFSTMTTSANVCIGARNAGTQDNYGIYYYNGDIAVVQIYDRQLTDDEVKQNFNAYRGRFGI